MAKSGWTANSISGYGQYSVYIPPSGVTPKTQIFVFSCNPHDYSYGWLSYVKQKQKEHPENIYMVIPSVQDGDTKSVKYFTNDLVNIMNEYNIPSTNINMFSWSNGNKGSSALASSLNGKGYTIGKFVNVFGNFDGKNSNTFFSNFNTGKSSAFPYIYIDDGSNHSSYSGASSTFSTFQKNCNDYIIVKVKNPNNHNFYSADNKYNFVDLFLAGEDLSQSVTITRYVNGVAQTLSYDEFVKIVNTGSIDILYEKYKSLDEFSEFFSGGTGDTLASNLAFVSNSMHGIKSKITSHNDINYTKGSDNEAGVVGAMYASANYYGAVTNVLYGNLSAEADAVYAIANAIYKMDGVASVIAETSLTDAMKGLYSTSNPSVSTELEKLKSATSDLFNTAKNAVMANGRYEEISNILGGKVAEGSVGKISISALESAINSIVPSLNNEVEKAMGLKAGVDEFMSGIGSSNILQGGVWEDVKTNMANYQNLLDCNMKASQFISDTLKTAMGIIVDYMGEDTELDDSKLPELRKQLEELTTKIAEMNAELSRMKSCTKAGPSTTVTDPETGEPKSVPGPDVPCYSESEINAYDTQIKEKETQKEELEKDIKKLEGLAPIVEAAQSIIQSAIDQVKAMYENPVTDANGNQSFVANFNLDLSAYGINSEKDYKKIIDDYYDKLNPKTEPPTTASIPTEAPADEWEGGGPTGPGTPSVPTDAPTNPVTEAPTEEVTETPTEEITEAPTEESTEETTEGATEVVSETPTETPTEVVATPTEAPTSGGHHGGGGGGGSSEKPPKPGVETEPLPIDIPTEVETIPWEIEPEPDTDIYYEPELETEEEIEIEIPPEEIIDVQPKKSNGIKTMGIAAGVGLAIGAAALGAHTIVKNKVDEDEEEDYGYEK